MSKKNESKRKIDLKSAILLLLLLAVLLTATTYAWFTANKTVTVTDIDVNIAAQNGLQISANGVDWGATVTVDDLKTGYSAPGGTKDTNQLPSTMVPVSTIGDVSAGKMKMFYGELSPSGTTYALTATEEATEQKGTTGKYVAFDIFLKVNQNEPTILLGENSHVIFKDDTDRGIQNAARVAFLKEGNNLETAGQDAFVTQNSAASFTTASQETTYIWEPNSDVHTTTAVTYGKDTYKMGNSEHSAGKLIDIKESNSAVIPCYGINSAINTPGVKLINAFYGTNFDLETPAAISNFTKITPSYSTPAAYSTTSTPETAFSLSKGVTKLRVYMWIEGQDVDCENSASGSNASFKLEFRLPEGS